MPGTAAIDLHRVRADTPGCHAVIHLDNAGSSLPPRQVVDAQVEYLRTEALRGGYRLAEERREELDGTYAALAQLIGAKPSNIALTSNATESWQLAFHSIRFADGDRILTSEAEYASSYIGFLARARHTDLSIEVIPSDDTGRTSPAALAAMLDERVKLVAIAHVPTNGGLVNPAAEIGTVANQAGIPYLLDACQSVGQLDLDVAELGCDFLTATGRKFLRGPRGTGFLYAGPSILKRTEPPFLDLHGAGWTAVDRYEMRDDARRYETWEFNYAAVRGLGVAARYALGVGMAAIEARTRMLAERLRGGLVTIDGVTVRDLGTEKAGIVTLDLAGVAAADLAARLVAAGVNCTATTPASTRIDAARRRLPDLVRLSPHYYNTEEELERTVDIISAAAR